MIAVYPLWTRINLVNAATLQAHPYIRWKEANIIIAYRNEHGFYHSMADLRKVLALPESFIEKLSPYLSFKLPPDQTKSSSF